MIPSRPSIFYIFLSRKFWMSVISMLVAVGVLSFSDAEQAEMVSLIVGGLGAVYTIAVAIEDGMRAKAEAHPTTTVETPSSNVTVTTSENTPPTLGTMG